MAIACKKIAESWQTFPINQKSFVFVSFDMKILFIHAPQLNIQYQQKMSSIFKYLSIYLKSYNTVCSPNNICSLFPWMQNINFMLSKFDPKDVKKCLAVRLTISVTTGTIRVCDRDKKVHRRFKSKQMRLQM